MGTVHRFTVHENDLPFNGAVAIRPVDDPKTKGDRIAVTYALRDDPLAGLLARRQIDKAQFEAGRRWQLFYEAAGAGTVSAIDPLREPVDGHGASRAGVTDRHCDAIQEIRDAAIRLGFDRHVLTRMVLGDGLTIQEIARRKGRTDQSEVKFIGRDFRRCLEILAEHWGFA